MTNETPQNGWTLNTVLEATGGRLLGEVGDKPISGISTDSRTLRPGELFLALAGLATSAAVLIFSFLTRTQP